MKILVIAVILFLLAGSLIGFNFIHSDIPKATPTIQYSEPIGPTQEFPYRLPSRSILNG